MTEKVTETKSVWAWVPVGLLGSMLCGLGVLAYIATDDPHFALEPNYYDKAVHWDRAQSEAKASAETGIRAEIAPLVIDQHGSVELRVRLTNRDGSALNGAVVKVEAFPNAYAARIRNLELAEREPGLYTARIERSTRGLWELRLEAEQGGQHFREVRRVDVVHQVKS